MLLIWNVSYFHISTARVLGRVWVRIKECDKKGTWKCMNKNKEYDLHDRYDLWTHISSMGNYKWRFRENHEFSSNVWNMVSIVVLASCTFGILLELYNLGAWITFLLFCFCFSPFRTYWCHLLCCSLLCWLHAFWHSSWIIQYFWIQHLTLPWLKQFVGIWR